MRSVGLHPNRRITKQSKGKKLKTAGESQTYGKGLCQSRKNEKLKRRILNRRQRTEQK